MASLQRIRQVLRGLFRTERPVACDAGVFRRRILASALLVLAAAPCEPSGAAAAGGPFPEETAFTIDRAPGEGRASSSSRPSALHFRAFGRRFDLAVQANEGLVAPGARALLVRDAGNATQPLPVTWLGRGEDGSEARFQLDGQGVRGFVRSTSGIFVFEPSVDGGSSHVVRRAEDLVPARGDLGCGAHEGSTSTAGARAALESSPAIAGAAAPDRVLDVAVVADHEFYRAHGDRSVADIVGLFNQVDALMRDQLGIRLEISQVVVYGDADVDPLSATTSASTLLDELSRLRQAGAAASGAVTHLLTGRSLSDANGLAWIAGACDGYRGAGLSAVDDVPGFYDTILVAHELGHGLGASHDGDVAGPCAATPPGYVMWPQLGSSSTTSYSDCSRASIRSTIADASCLAASVPATCGNGELDEGEDCDASVPGSNGCCRDDCRFAFAGLSCGDSANACVDPVCDGEGSCVEVPNDDACASGDACEAARCVDGQCVPTGDDRGFGHARMNFRVSDGGMLGAATLTATSPALGDGGDPCVAGMQLRALVGETTAWSEYLAPERWVAKRSGGFVYKSASVAAGGVVSARVRLDSATGQVSYRLKLAAPMVAMPPSAPSVLVLSGDRTDGQCGSQTLSHCVRRGGRFLCE